MRDRQRKVPYKNEYMANIILLRDMRIFSDTHKRQNGWQIFWQQERNLGNAGVKFDVTQVQTSGEWNVAGFVEVEDVLKIKT